jgi:hypothetical protein
MTLGLCWSLHTESSVSGVDPSRRGPVHKLLRIPEADQETIRDRADEHVPTELGKPRDYAAQTVTGEEFSEYIDWRVDHPSDDNGCARSLTRAEILNLVTRHPDSAHALDDAHAHGLGMRSRSAVLSVVCT